MLVDDGPGTGLFLSPVPVPQGDPAALSRAAATYTSAQGEIDRGRATLTSAVSQADGTGWAGGGAAACFSAASKLALAYSRTASALAQGATALRMYSAGLAAAQQTAHLANNAVTVANGTARALVTAQDGAQRAQYAADEASRVSSAADAQASANPHSPAALLAAQNARSAADDALSAASTAVARMSALSGQYDAERSHAVTLCAQATEQASRATTQAVAALDAAATPLTGPPQPAHGGATGVHHHEGFWSGLLHDAEHLPGDVVNGVASLGNAAIHDTGGALSILGGLALTGVSGGGEALGFTFDATGVGSVVGVPLNVVSAAGITTGTGLVAGGATSIVRNALGPDRVTLMNSDGELPQTGHGAERAADPSRLNPEEQAEVVANPTQTFTQGDDAEVFVQQVGDRYNVVVQGARGVITNLKNISQSSLNRLAANYKWTPN